MPTQYISVLKVAGSAGTLVRERLREWAAMGQEGSGGSRAAEPFPPEVRRAADGLADLLRSYAASPPVVHFVEWVDMWSTGDTVARWLAPGGGPAAARVPGDRHELFGYFLPDEGELARHLADAGPQQHPEAGWLVQRLREAVESWSGVADRASVLVLRRVTAPSVTDEELLATLPGVPTWLSELSR